MLAYPWLAHKYKMGLDERKAFYSDEKKEILSHNPLWVHAVSVGEVQSAWPLLGAVKNDSKDIPVVLSTTTSTGREMAFKLAPGLFETHIYYPWDIPWIVSRALDIMQPRAYAVIETEIWPNLLKELAKRKIPAFLVNGRFSETTSSKGKKQSAFWRDIFSCFTRLMVRAQSDADYLLSLGIDIKKIIVTGDCKVDALALRQKAVDLSWARKIIGEKKPIFLAGSTHTGEDEIILEAFSLVKARVPEARLIIVPRHPERAEAISLLAQNVASVERLSSLEKEWSILIVDKIGVLFDLYGICDSAFIGGSLVPKGGQNLMEAAIFGVPICHGPDMEDFPEAAGALGEKKVAITVHNAKEIAEWWIKSLSPSLRDDVRRGARQYFEGVGGAAQISWREIREVMR
ncbi:glycosyltransferase N-terminal domain-containing protein [Aminobacterium sp. MB27-C1]|jgi:3-deoxy-D-manno-octulosonic-acid transferase|uniref:3-deoxy-D-manno-octulosonic acid transferase n=1 Tax=Aminobacterium sp. MB27-C1 TaxID=3070661 RepID=UPI0027DD382E|nr:glycosyltransferase N-terminal domain-containing protein [Aminobacterium sp. MB27-C1]WMI71963.1 glycosyltransferase N-terminal domain-containing protein [Aminobacterium sp. MB27-C1]